MGDGCGNPQTCIAGTPGCWVCGQTLRNGNHAVSWDGWVPSFGWDGHRRFGTVDLAGSKNTRGALAVVTAGPHSQIVFGPKPTLPNRLSCLGIKRTNFAGASTRRRSSTRRACRPSCALSATQAGSRTGARAAPTPPPAQARAPPTPPQAHPALEPGEAIAHIRVQYTIL